LRIFVAITIFLSTTLVFAEPNPKFKVRCRKILHGSFHVDKFDDWQVVTNSMDSKLSGVSIEKYDKLPSNALPDNFDGKGKMTGSWKLNGGNYWLTCRHSEMKMVTVQKLSENLKTCKASETQDAVEVECN